MKAFTHAPARDPAHAVELSRQAREEGREPAFVGGGSDLLGMIKERIVEPDVLVGLKGMSQLAAVAPSGDGLRVGGQTTLDALSRDAALLDRYAVLAEAAGSVATPQIRNVATLAGNLCQRPWCWYYRAGFHCFKRGGTLCYSVVGENRHHALFGANPSWIVHPSDTAVALVALEATFRIQGAAGEREVPASEFFTLPSVDPTRENVLEPGELLLDVTLPAPGPQSRSRYFKVLDREAWTHAVVSVAAVLEMEGDLCRAARVVLGGVAPVPWRVPRVEEHLAGQRLTPERIARAAELSVEGARPLEHNGYKVPLTRGAVRRTLAELSGVA